MDRLGHVLVLGLGKSGVAAADYCLRLLESDVDSVTVADAVDSAATRGASDRLANAGATVLLGSEEIEGSWDLCIASPGIPPHAPLLSSAKSAARRTVSEIEFAFERSRSPWVAVTGTNGKTTTTALIAHLLSSAGMAARVVGNIGVPAIEVVSDAGPAEVLVAEVSSFQLSLTQTFHPRVAVLLNITPDHLDWHGSMEAYRADKAKVFANLSPDDTAVIDVDDEGSAPYADIVAASGCSVVRVSLSRAYPGGATADKEELVLETRSGPVRLVSTGDLRIRGAHNVSNALAAAAATHALGVTAADLQAGLRSFEPIEHRLEPVGCVAGVEWFNDSKATNPDAVFKALAAFDERPVILLLGGRNKGNDFRPLATEAIERTRAVIAFGEAGDEITAAFKGTAHPVTRVAGLAEAVEAAAGIAHPGDAVVLSPACASFDEFESFEHRGRVFKDLIADLESRS